MWLWCVSEYCCGASMQDLEEEVSPHKLVASPTPVSHHHSSPSPLPPTSSQLSPEHKHPVASLPPSSTPPLYLTARTSKLKQGFIFDEDRISSDSLPKFLSNRWAIFLSVYSNFDEVLSSHFTISTYIVDDKNTLGCLYNVYSCDMCC